MAIYTVQKMTIHPWHFFKRNNLIAQLKNYRSLSFLLIMVVCYVCLGQKQTPTRIQPPIPVEEISTNMVMASSVMDVDGRRIHLDLIYCHEIVTNAPEIQLVADDDGKKYIIWWVDTGRDRMLPNERQIATGDKKNVVGFCFSYGAAPLLFYEINAAKVLQEAKSMNGRVAPSAWIHDRKEGDDLKQEVVFTKLPNMQRDCISVNNLQMRQEKGQWMISIDASSFDGDALASKIAKTKYYYQYPVGGTGLIFLRKELVPGVPEDALKCRENMNEIMYAKAKWAARYGKQAGDEVDTNQLFNILLKGEVIKCPDGGVYDVGAVGEMPKCSIHGVFKR